MKEILDFLREIRRNNNRDWFEANKARYKTVQAEFNALAEQLIAGISSFDPSVRGLTVRDCTYRIYRDTRFSNNKDPYKIHMGAYICPYGKKSGYAGYYFHVEPEGEDMMGGNFLTSGLYMPDSRVLKSLRYEISENTKGFEDSIRKAKGFTLDRANSLKRLPAGFTPGNTYDDYLKLKDIYLTRQMDEDYLLDPDLVKNVVRDFGLTADFTRLLNKAVRYAFEEETGD